MVGLIKSLMLGLTMLLGVFYWQGIAVAAEAGSGNVTVLSIDVEGNRYVEKETVLAKMATKVGQPLDRRQLSRDVRMLYKAGFFSDIRFVGTRTSTGIHLMCHVKEYPLIANLTMEGNDEFAINDLQMRMKLKPGRTFSPMNQRSDRHTLLKGYLKDGFYQVSVDFIAKPRKDGRVDVLVHIHEGEITRINRIHMIGNKTFSDATLRDELASSQSSLGTWFSDKDVFDQERFGADAQMLQQYYLNHGYLDMKVDSRQITISEDRSTFSLTFSVHEGESYVVDSIGMQGDLVPDQETLQELIEMQAGDTYSLSDMRMSIEAITERVGDEGYAFATVTPLMNRNINAHTVGIIFDIEKGEEVYIERIEISGNKKSEDHVVRRLIKQSEGARYSGSQIKQTQQSLRRAAFVEDLRIAYPKGSSGDKVRMKVDMTEKKTGSLSGGVGFSQQEKVIITAKVADENLFGKGYQVNLSGELGQVTQNITADLTDPFFLGSHISASINAFKTQTDPITTVNYQTDSLGGGFGFGIPISHQLSYGIQYQLKRTDLSKVPIGAPRILLAQQGRHTIGEVTNTLRWDTRDKVVGSSSGHKQELRLGIAGLGGDSKFWEGSISSSLYIPFGEARDVVLSPSFSAKMIRGYGGKDIPLWRRYSMGGIGSIRGIDTYGISLRDQGEAVGGENQARASINLFSSLPYVNIPNLRGLLYIDAGLVWGSLPAAIATTPVNEPFSLSRVRYTAGFGIEWASPFAPIALIWSFPIRTLPGDIERSFEFALGVSF